MSSDDGGAMPGDDGSNFPWFETSWGDLSLPGWLTSLRSVSGTLLAFGKNPRGFIVGALMAELLIGIETIALAILDAVDAVFDSLVSIPRMTGSALTDAGRQAGIPLLQSVLATHEAIIGWIAGLGPFAPVVVTGWYMLEIIVIAWTFRKIVEVAFDLVPGLGGLVK